MPWWAWFILAVLALFVVDAQATNYFRGRNARLASGNAEARLRTADAVARVWIDGLMDDADDPRDQSLRTLRVCAHPLACVRAALAGETEAKELGCDPDKLKKALG